MLRSPTACAPGKLTRLLGCLAAVLTITIGAPRPAVGQLVLEGFVVDDVTNDPLAGARILLVNRYGRVADYTVTDNTGHFRFERSEYGLYRLDVKAVGYEPAVTSSLWMLQGRDFAELEVRLAPNAVLLAPLEIIALSPLGTSPVLQNMMHRRTRGFGYHITREDIERRRPAQVSDMLTELPGVHANRRGPGAQGRTIYMGRALVGVRGGECPVQIFLDGVLASVPGGEVSVDDLVHPEDIEAIEVFRGLASIPPEFLTPNARCGVIAIWTRRSLELEP